jgi:hypothetical protein
VHHDAHLENLHSAEKLIKHVCITRTETRRAVNGTVLNSRATAEKNLSCCSLFMRLCLLMSVSASRKVKVLTVPLMTVFEKRKLQMLA